MERGPCDLLRPTGRRPAFAAAFPLLRCPVFPTSEALHSLFLLPGMVCHTGPLPISSVPPCL